MSREFRLILRVLGADVDGTKKVPFGLSRIRGVGPNFAQAVVKVARISPEARIGSLSETEIARLEDIIKDPAKHGIPSRLFNRRKDIESGRDMHLVGPDLALRNKRELRRHETMLSKIRGIARSLLGATEEQTSQIESQYLKRLFRLGILPESAGVDNILDLNVKDLMERRLQTIAYRSGLARSIHQARQFVSHGHISVANEIVSVPSYIVKRDEESRIAFDQRSPLTNAQHPARAAPGGKRLARVIEEAPVAVPTMPVLPVVSPEIKEEVQAEQPLELVEPDEELAAEPEPEKK